jgi:hypothetical protein
VSEPAGDGPFRSVAELREHLERAGAVGFAQGNAVIDWSTALLSPGAGLFLFRSTGRPAEWRIAHTGTGLVVAKGLPGGRKGARDVMGALERVEAPNGRPIDWTVPDADTLRQQILDSGFSPSALLAAAREAADPASDRPLTASEARSLLREAVALNLKARGRENEDSRRRDVIVSRLLTAGYPANVDDYEHPSAVPTGRAA